jgi:uncharacterized protein
MRTLDSKPLSDAEFERLDAWIDALPAERDPLDVAMLDGFMTGVLLSREVVLPSRWLPIAFDAREGESLFPGDAAEVEEILRLVMRHYNTLAAHIAAREPFEPYVIDVRRDDGGELTDEQKFAGLWPWAAGFARAVAKFPLVDDDAEEGRDIDAALVHILRHVPDDPDDTSELARELADEKREIAAAFPLDDIDHAVDEVVESVMEIADITRPRRPISRKHAKVGRNESCPCGSGKKYKHCHGRATD